MAYSEERATDMLARILGRPAKPDDCFASADFYSMFFTLKTWTTNSEADVVLSESLEVRFKEFKERERQRAAAAGRSLAAGALFQAAGAAVCGRGRSGAGCWPGPW